MSNTLVANQVKRNPNIEVFRCLLMFLIVLHHCAYCGYFKKDDSQWLMLILYTGFTMWHVDGFIAISGWFGVRFSWKKFAALWGEMAFYTLLSFFWTWGVGGSFSLKSLIVNGGWFGGTYLMFMFFAPLLNEAIESAVVHGTAKRI